MKRGIQEPVRGKSRGRADGTCVGRLRSEEEAMQGYRRRQATQRCTTTPIPPKGNANTLMIRRRLQRDLAYDSDRLLHFGGGSIGENQAGATRVAWEGSGEEYDRAVHHRPTALRPGGNLGLPADWGSGGETG